MKKLTTVFAILVMAIAALADAGVGQMPSGGSAGIMGDDLGIRLAEETVVVELEKDSDGFSFDVRAEFSLYNDGSGKSVFLFLPVSSVSLHSSERNMLIDGNNPVDVVDKYDVWLGLSGTRLRHQLFVVRKLYDGEDYIAPKDHIPFLTNDGQEFALWPISRATDEDLDIIFPEDYASWGIWAVCSVDIPAGDSTLRYYYTGVPGWNAMSSFSNFYYPLWSGASWSGTIGAGTVTYLFGDELTTDDTFGYYAPEEVEVQIEDNYYQFTFENYEPQPGASVSVRLVTNNEPSLYRNEGLRVVPDSDAAFVNGVESVEDYHHLYVLEAQGKWLKLRAEYKGGEVTGWSLRNKVCFHDLGAGQEMEMVWHNPINFRTEPDSSAERVAGCPTISPGEYFPFLERKGDWLRTIVRFSLGWARWRYLDPDSGEELIYIKTAW